MLRIPNRLERVGLFSTSTFAIFTFSPCSLAISSNTGAIVRQGPHQEAQKSTKIGTEDSLTTCSKLDPSKFIIDADWLMLSIVPGTLLASVLFINPFICVFRQPISFAVFRILMVDPVPPPRITRSYSSRSAFVCNWAEERFSILFMRAVRFCDRTQ